MTEVTSTPAGKFLVFQIGCIECGVSSYPIKICKTLEEAKEVEKNHPSTWDSEGGDGCVMIIDLDACKDVDDIEETQDD